MFTLSAILLEDRENLFQDFWTQFSISFVCFPMSDLFKKTKHRPNGSCSTRTPPGRPLKGEARAPAPPAPPEALAPPAPPRNPRRRQPLSMLGRQVHPLPVRALSAQIQARSGPVQSPPPGGSRSLPSYGGKQPCAPRPRRLTAASSN